MKLTINVDEALLDRVVEITEAASKTEAITIALREIDRRARLVDVLREGLGASTEELKEMFDPASDPSALRVAESSASYRAGASESGD
ncbi:MAG: type II toxin-antitoxin system VapB family antitoxin [Verrucomicrobiae bacterium]|nr:type II toxin-antitoxin system VapB family antitoxin [Verrucomicrobiae bacterium]